MILLSGNDTDPLISGNDTDPLSCWGEARVCSKACRPWLSEKKQEKGKWGLKTFPLLKLQNYQGGLFKHGLLGHTPSFWFSRPGISQSFAFLMSSEVDLMLLVWGPHLRTTVLSQLPVCCLWLSSAQVVLILYEPVLRRSSLWEEGRGWWGRWGEEGERSGESPLFPFSSNFPRVHSGEQKLRLLLFHHRGKTRTHISFNIFSLVSYLLKALVMSHPGFARLI